MPVQEIQSATRVLAILEAICENGPVSLRAVARLTGQDQSGVQRSIVTLATAGWIERGNFDGWTVTDRARMLFVLRDRKTRVLDVYLDFLRIDVRQARIAKTLADKELRS